MKKKKKKEKEKKNKKVIGKTNLITHSIKSIDLNLFTYLSKKIT